MLKKFDNSDLKKISDWAANELATMRKTSRVPIITKLANGNYRVAATLIEFTNGLWTVNDKVFFDKRSAIFYSILLSNNNIAMADKIRMLDADVIRLEFDTGVFRYRLDKAHQESDQFGIDLFASRHAESKLQFKQAKVNLEHFINNQFRNLSINKNNTTF